MADHGMQFVSGGRVLGRLRFQLPIGISFVALLPAILYYGGSMELLLADTAALNSIAGCAIAFVTALLLFRRVISFPGIGVVAHVLPASTASYSLTLVGYLGMRWNYSGVVLSFSFAACVALLLLVSLSLRSMRGRRFYVVPSVGSAVEVLGGFEWSVLQRPALPNDPNLVLIADLRADMSPEWEKLIADAALAGHPVYHIKQVRESLTGKVEIEHLSENSFGSLIPNLSYRKLKRAADVLAVLLAAPLLALPCLVVALLIKLDSPGPAFFRQPRRGYRGEVFTVVKFRTMIDRATSLGQERANAVTLSDDARITRLGQFLRRSRIDELPQLWNVLLGEMSWIGPRPEALPLSEWYSDQLPFYSYRHIVRPGITGWAQVNQGHVADLDAVFEKLQYDFYYIKNFSAWLDMLIVWRTVITMLSGFGAR